MKLGYLVVMKKQEDLRLKLNNPKLNFFIGDVRNYNSIFYALKDIDYVFHVSFKASTIM